MADGLAASTRPIDLLDESQLGQYLRVRQQSAGSAFSLTILGTMYANHSRRQ